MKNIIELTDLELSYLIMAANELIKDTSDPGSIRQRKAFRDKMTAIRNSLQNGEEVLLQRGEEEQG
jgi:hypothetical protein